MSILKSGKIRFIAIASLLGLLTTANTGVANAGNYGVDLYLGNGTGIYFSGHSNHRKKSHRKHRNHYSYNPGYYDPYYQPRRKHQRHKHYRNQQRRHVCGPRRALNKAYRLGLNNPQIHRIKDHRIVVSGYQYGYRSKMVFKRHSNCHLIKTVNFHR